MKLTFSILVICPVLFVATAVWPQAKPASPAKSSFDGRYIAQSVQCFPNTGQNRVAAYVIKDNKFSHRFTLAGRTQSCAVTINTDGSFDNKACDVPTSGKIVGDTMELNYKNEDRMCKVTMKREQ